jgi:hypothetical protein
MAFRRTTFVNRIGRIFASIKSCGSESLGVRNYLIEGLSGTSKTSVCNDLQRRGYHAIHGDRELAYRAIEEPVSPWIALRARASYLGHR